MKRDPAGRSLAARRKHILVYKPVYIQKLVPNLYRDSVSLMQLSAALTKLPGVEQASAIMATPANLELLREARLLNGDKLSASPNDLLLALRGKSVAALQAALAHAVAALDKPAAAPASDGLKHEPLRSLQMALGEAPKANLALISVPGDYAAAEAMKALRHRRPRSVRGSRRRHHAPGPREARAGCRHQGDRADFQAPCPCRREADPRQGEPRG